MPVAWESQLELEKKSASLSWGEIPLSETLSSLDVIERALNVESEDLNTYTFNQNI